MKLNKVKLGGNPNVVIAVPDIVEFKIKDNYDYILLACDGIFDKMTNKEWNDTIWNTVRKTSGNIHKVAGECVEMVLKTSIAKRTIDNITVVIVCLRNIKRSLLSQGNSVTIII